ncbi:MAG: hypothetical protein JWO82_4466 [Akkermansiaceae bacterium]|nr:hypothetical protein [Akkermansiaceae bacterium]
MAISPSYCLRTAEISRSNHALLKISENWIFPATEEKAGGLEPGSEGLDSHIYPLEAEVRHPIFPPNRMILVSD